ncbi:MAG: hypothetical protein HY819_24540 [Acidobacteria bacterium]|nr:hypothetical protein [Acidobacteriota bacterium]
MIKNFNLLFFLTILLFLLFIFSNFVYGQEFYPSPSLNLHKWGSVTLFHGLPSNHVRAIAQDNDGTLWFGTDSGLAKNDGRRTQKVLASLPSERVSVLKLEFSGELWIGTDAGATRLVNNEFLPINETVGYSISSIINPRPGELILSSLQGVIFFYTLADHKIISFETFGPNDSALLTTFSNTAIPLPITRVISNGDALLLATRGRGLLEIKNKQVKEIYLRPRSFFVEAVAKDKTGNILIGAQTSKEDSGVFQSTNLNQVQKIGSPTGNITSICVSPKGDFWVSSSERGAFHYKDGLEIERFTFENSGGGLQSNQVYTIFIDQEEVIWFGTDRGVCRYDPNSPHAEKISDQAENNFIRVFFQSTTNQLWAGSNRGLFTRETKAIGWQQISEIANSSIYSIYETNNQLIIGTSGGLYASSLDKQEIYKDFMRIDKDPADTSSKDIIRAICFFKEKFYLASQGRGLEILENGQRKPVWSVEKIDSSLKDIISLYVDDKRMWIGTTKGGVWYYDGENLKSDKSFEILKNSPIRAILGSHKDLLWLGTDKGLYQYKNNELSLILKDIEVWSLVASGNNSIWCATDGKGIFKINLNDWVGITLSRLGNEHGLPSDKVFTLFSKNPSEEESLWIGTNRGIAEYRAGKKPAILRFTRILGSQIYQLTDLERGLDLAYPQNSLVIDVTALSSRTFPEQFQYLFLLFDDKNKIIKQRLAKDTQFLTENLRPGIYRIEVRAYTGSLSVSKPIILFFTVASAPFPWTTLALSILLALSLFALWWGYHQNAKLFGTNKALATANEQLAETRLQLASETENERKRIARDLHDQTLSDLRQLIMMADQLPAESNGDKRLQSNTFRREIESISTEIRRICEDLSPSVLTNVGLTAALEWSLTEAIAHLPKEEKFDYEFICDDELEEKINFDSAIQIQIYRIVQEAISNICKHAKAKKVFLNVDISEDNIFTVLISDDGCGFTVGKKTGRGLSNIRSRASLIEAEVFWQTNPLGGTLFKLQKHNLESNNSETHN